jgi:hypothetical protein
MFTLFAHQEDGRARAHGPHCPKIEVRAAGCRSTTTMPIITMVDEGLHPVKDAGGARLFDEQFHCVTYYYGSRLGFQTKAAGFDRTD